MVIVAIERAFAGLPPALHTGNTSGKAHDLPVCAIARPLPCPDISGVRILAVQSASDAAFGGWMMNCATFDSAGAIVAIGHSRDRGCRLACCLRIAEIQNNGAAPRKDISAPSLSTNWSSPVHRSKLNA